MSERRYTDAIRRQRQHQSAEGELDILNKIAHPATSAEHNIVKLQRVLGNRGVMQLMRSSAEHDAAHTHACRCPACTGRLQAQPAAKSPAASVSAPSAAVSRTIIQRCKFCGNIKCVGGKVCGQTDRFTNLFLNKPSREAGIHKNTKKHSKRGEFESEHMLPVNAWRKSGKRYSSDDLPALSIPYKMHRGGQSGAGGGISSTGSSHTASAWSDRLGAMMRSGNMAGAIRSVANDEYNAGLVSGNLDDGLVQQIMQVIFTHAERGDITQQEAGEIATMIYNRWLEHIAQLEQIEKIKEEERKRKEDEDRDKGSGGTGITA